MSALLNHSGSSVFGYVEGYYGRLLSWPERSKLLGVLAEHGYNSYFYGPKDDAKHRVLWREAYDGPWRNSFRQFTEEARQLGISVIAGVAPGLDFNFGGMDSGQGDLALLCDKSRQLFDDGAAAISLMMDDIDNDFHKRRGDFQCEGDAHAELANHLLPLAGNCNPVQQNLPSVFCVPRIYANELLANNDLTMPAMSAQEPDQRKSENSDSRGYIPSFTSRLDPDISWIYCGKHVVSRQPEVAHSLELGASLQHRVVIWDNYYANDYCPRRLFLGAWKGRSACTDLLLNGTGLPYTDCLLLSIVAAIRTAEQSDTHGNSRRNASIADIWHKCLSDAGVPDDFFQLQSYFNHPVFSDVENGISSGCAAGTSCDPLTIEKQIAAIDKLLWCWKAPLAREWYPYLFGLKHDLQIASNTMPESRVRKTQTPVLADYIVRHTTTSGQ